LLHTPLWPIVKELPSIGLNRSYYPASYRHDRRLERKDCDQKVVLKKLDEKKIKDHWEDFCRNPKRYNMVNRNCSTIVATLLEIGSNVPPGHSPQIKINQYVSDPIQKWFFKLRFLGNHIKMWTPNDVFQYALQIKATKGS
jgi:hypothetical protein